MAYTTIAIVREESPFKDDQSVVDDYITRAIAEADSFINGRIGGVYLLPLTEVPAIIQKCSTTLTFLNLLKDQNLNIEVASGVNISEAVEDALAKLTMIADRDLKLFDSSDEELAVIDLIKPVGFPDNSSTEDGTAIRHFTSDQDF